MITIRRRLARALLLLLALAGPAVLMSACGGGGGGSQSASSKVKKLLGQVYAKVIGDKIGEFKAQVKDITSSPDLSEIEGTVTIDGHTMPFKAMVNADHTFFVRAEQTDPPAGGNGATVLASAEISGTLGEATVAYPDSLSISGKITSNLKTPSGWAYFNSTMVNGKPGTDTSSSSGGGACEWISSAFYNERQVVSYKGATYTAKRQVVPFGEAGVPLFNPATDVNNWTPGGTCGPVPFVKVTSATCSRGANADTVTMEGTAYGGGVGDALTAYVNLTDASFSNENNFGLPGRSYTMSCTGGGFSSTFQSKVTPIYSVCVKKEESAANTQWKASYVIAHSATAVNITTAYASKGNPLLANIFTPGAIVLGLDAVRSEGVPVTGNCN